MLGKEYDVANDSYDLVCAQSSSIILVCELHGFLTLKTSTKQRCAGPIFRHERQAEAAGLSYVDVVGKDDFKEAVSL